MIGKQSFPPGAMRLMLSIITLSVFAACGSPIARAVSTTSVPGQAVITFPNSPDAQWKTVLSSEPLLTQAGIDGRALTVSIYHGAASVQNDLTLDLDGNLGVRGVFRSVSSRQAKWAIHPYTGDALRLLRDLDISTFHYRGEAGSQILHVGFIAENAPEILAGKNHDSFNLNNSLAITMAATKKLDVRMQALAKHIVELEQVIRQMQTTRICSNDARRVR